MFNLELLLASLADPKRMLETLLPNLVNLPKAAAMQPLPEKDIVHLMRFASVLSEAKTDPGKTGQAEQYATNLSQPMQVVVKESLTQVAEEGTAKDEHGVLQRMASIMAIQNAARTFDGGKLGADEVDGLFDRLTKEMGDLAPQPEEEDETAGGILKDQFWATASEEKKKQTLLSSEAWCVPPKQIEPMVRHMLEEGENQNAYDILIQYANCVKSPNPATRRVAARGLRKMSKLFASSFSEVLEETFERLTGQIANEEQASLKKLLTDAYVQINKDAEEILKPTPGQVELHCQTCMTETISVLAIGDMLDTETHHQKQLYCLKCGDATSWTSLVRERREEKGQPEAGAEDKRTGAERRTTRRVQMNMPIRVRSEAPGQDFVVISKTIDISKGGALFPCQRAMPVGLTVKVLMPYDPNQDIPETEARVVRCLDRDEGFEIAVQLLT